VTTSRARQLRAKQTDVERQLWFLLRDRRLNGAKFRRQVPIGSYIVDFVCQEAKLIVELDGSQHADQVAYDTARSDWLSAHGYRVLRFWNNDLTENEEGVLTAILNELTGSNPHAQAH
jgi:very-short-patch-repair endonuclease